MLDTCIWLNLTKWQQTPALSALAKLVADKRLRLLVPEVVSSEFKVHRQSVVDRFTRAATSHTLEVKALADMLPAADQTAIKKSLDDLAAAIRAKHDVANANLNAIDKLIASVKPIITTVETKAWAADQALRKMAPCHKNKNSIADTIIIRQFSESKAPSGHSRIYVSENIEDFSDPKDNRNPHPHIASMFDQTTSRYFIDLVSALNFVEPGILAESTSHDFRTLERHLMRVAVAACSHDFDDSDGFWGRSQFGGLTWQYRCRKCQALFDTGDSYD